MLFADLYFISTIVASTNQIGFHHRTPKAALKRCFDMSGGKWILSGHYIDMAVAYSRGVARIESKGRQKSRIRGSSGLRVRLALEERTLGGVWGHAPPETFWISDRCWCNLGVKYSAVYMAAAPAAPCRSSCVLNYAISGQEISKFCTRPSIITLTAFLPVAGPADQRVDQLS